MLTRTGKAREEDECAVRPDGRQQRASEVATTVGSNSERSGRRNRSCKIIKGALWRWNIEP
uniref:Uncharacterized protein n=1 Tax=Arundo donax TaxID=35708 RepID=A0A0A8ZRE0_ARUDO